MTDPWDGTNWDEQRSLYLLAKRKVEELDRSVANINDGSSYDTGWLDVTAYRRLRFMLTASQNLTADVRFRNDTNKVAGETASYIGGDYDGHDYATYGKDAKVLVSNSSGATATSVEICVSGVR